VKGKEKIRKSVKGKEKISKSVKGRKEIRKSLVKSVKFCHIKKYINHKIVLQNCFAYGREKITQ